eukprot:7280030-Prymnesium_polylepis.1
MATVDVKYECQPHYGAPGEAWEEFEEVPQHSPRPQQLWLVVCFKVVTTCLDLERRLKASRKRSEAGQ